MDNQSTQSCTNLEDGFVESMENQNKSMIKLPDGTQVMKLDPDAKYIFIIHGLTDSEMRNYVENLNYFMKKVDVAFVVIRAEKVKIVDAATLKEIQFQGEQSEISDDVLQQTGVSSEHA